MYRPVPHYTQTLQCSWQKNENHKWLSLSYFSSMLKYIFDQYTESS